MGEATLKSVVRPLAEKLDQIDAKCKSLAERSAVEALREAFVQNLLKLRDGLGEQHTALGGGLRQLQELLPQYFNALPQYFTAIQQQVAALQQRVDGGLRAIVEELRPPEPEPSADAGPRRRLATGHPRPAAGRQPRPGSPSGNSSSAACWPASPRPCAWWAT